jgi:hypothetical protein
MKTYTLASNDGLEKTVFRQQSDDDLVWVDMYENGKIWKTFGLTKDLALNLKEHLLQNTNLVEDDCALLDKKQTINKSL